MALIFNPKTTYSILIIPFLFLLPFAYSLTFNFTSFPPSVPKIIFHGDAFSDGDGVLQVTKIRLDGNISSSIGRAAYEDPVRLWDRSTGRLTDFTTHFSFQIQAAKDSTIYGDGLSFYLAPFNNSNTIPQDSSGGYLGLFSPETALNASAKNQIVAVEFDSFKNIEWDPSENHVGINVDSIDSVAKVNWSSSIKDGRKANAWITYNSTTHNLSVFLTYVNNPAFSGNSSLSYTIDLSKVLPEFISVGFSAATGVQIETHSVLSWTFSSSLVVDGSKNNNLGLVVGLVVAFFVSISLLGISYFLWRRKERKRREGAASGGGEDHADDISMDDEFEKGTGPKRFNYGELSRATKDFSEEGKLGEGGFGGVYKGLLINGSSNIEIAVKRVSQGSKQGKKEYISEVRIISRLRHRNLVQLIGWCHEKNELLLVYEYMPNGSLDFHLFGDKISLTWPVRYKIGLGLASSLLYLHEEWEQCVVHRDIKSSNVMLDSQFNAKLGDFGLARLVDHDLGSQTTVLAGTMGYLAPECVTTGKASKESDVYSFGVVALEIACGRRPVVAREEPSKVRLVEWVWDLYGKGKLLEEAADKRLNMEFDERQMECLMIVGLWCCHPDFTLRPSIRQVINVLNFEAPLPELPSKLPVPTYYAPPMDMLKFSYTSSGLFTDSDKDQTTNSSMSSSKALLHSNKGDDLV